MQRGTIAKLCLSLSALTFLALAAGAQDALDVLHYDLDVNVLDDKLEEKVTIRVAASAWPKSWILERANCMKVLEVSTSGRAIPFKTSNRALELDLSSVPAPPSGQCEIAISVEGKPYNKFSEERRGFVRTTVSPDITYIRHQYPWYPRAKDDPATYQVVVRVKDGWTVRTAGDALAPVTKAGRRTWTFARSIPAWAIGLVAGPYQVVELAAAGGLVLDALVFPGDENGARTLLGAAKRAYEFYGRKFGPVRCTRFTLVEMPKAFGASSGYGEPGYVLIGEGAFKAAGKASWAEALVAHEVSHTWWGESVGFKNFASESLACYATLKFLEADKGKDAARKERERAVSRVVKAAASGKEIALDRIRSWGKGLDPETYEAHAYEKGMMLLAMIEETDGEKTLDRALARFFAEHQGQLVDYPRLRQALRRLCRKSRIVLDQWEEPGIPTLELAFEFRQSGRRCKVTGTLSQRGTGKPFRMNVEVVALCGKEKVATRVKLTGQKKKFTLTTPVAPEAVLVDPDYHLLAGRPGKDATGALDPFEEAGKVARNPGETDPEVLKKTIATLTDRLAKDPGKLEAVCHTYLGRCYFRLGDFDKAAASFKKSLRLGSGGPFHRAWVYLRLGCIADLQKHRNRAVGYYRKAIDQGDRYFAAKQAAKFVERPYRGHSLDH